MTKLSVNINKIATLRNARGGNVPDLLQVAKDIQKFGAQGITIHPRPDERHIRYQDARDLKKVVTTELSLLGSCAINGEYELVLDLMASGKISVDKMLSAVAPLSEGASWFNRLYNKEPGLNKVILVP